MAVISVEIRINGSIIAVLHAVNRGNTGKVNKAGAPQCEYDWTGTTFPLHLDGPPTVQAGAIRHFRDAGAIELARSMCDMYLHEEKQARGK